MDITASMMDTVRNRSAFPAPAQCSGGALCTPGNVQLTRQNYAAKIERVDYWLGEYMGWIEAAGQLARTLVCLASDHGEMLGDRQTTAKSKPWQSAMSVPIVCRGPVTTYAQSMGARTVFSSSLSLVAAATSTCVSHVAMSTCVGQSTSFG